MFCFAAKPKTNLSIVGNRTKKALNEPLELPMSPCTPSKLDLVTSQTQHRYIFNRFVIQSTVYFQIIESTAIGYLFQQCRHTCFQNQKTSPC